MCMCTYIDSLRLKMAKYKSDMNSVENLIGILTKARDLHEAGFIVNLMIMREDFNPHSECIVFLCHGIWSSECIKSVFYLGCLKVVVVSLKCSQRSTCIHTHTYIV